MALETMTKLASTTVGVGGSSSVIFSNIPQHYSDLVIKISCRTSRAADEDGLGVQLNNTTTGYTYRVLAADGSAATSINTAYGQLWTCRIQGASPGTNVFSTTDLYIHNYSGNSAKLITADSLTEKNGTNGYMTWSSVAQPDPSPVTSITLSGLNAAFQQHSVFTLYGVKTARKTAGNSIKATGGNIVFDGTYVYHVFNSTGAFVPTQPLTADVLAVAGGGGGGFGSGGGGGGAGGVIYAKNQSLSYSRSYGITVGSGGTGGIDSSSTLATSGSNSTFSTLTALGGGYGGSEGNGFPTRGIGGAGGSGGGGGDGANNGTPPQANYAGGAATQTSGTGYTGYGNAGGNANYGGGQYAAGGGGGAGGPGATPGTGGGAGGVGTTAFSDLLSAVNHGVNINGVRYIAGGGGGAYQNDTTDSTPGVALGGYGGGGNGGVDLQTGVNNFIATSALAFTGGGGGGGTNGWSNGAGTAVSPTTHSGIGGNGGSGLVIIRYKG